MLAMIAIGLTLLSIPFLLPIISWVISYRLRRRVVELEQRLSDQQSEIRALTNHVEHLLKAPRQTAAAEQPAPPTRAAASARPPVAAPPVPARPAAAPPVAPPPAVTLPVATKSAAPTPAPAPTAAPAPPPVPPARPAVPRPQAPPRPATAPAVPPVPPMPPRRPAPPSEPPPPAFSFDWERFVGVRLFSAIAGVALVVAAVFFLRYSLDSGWLQPPVRVVIGMLAGIGLLVACELKAARKYPATANAMDAAAIATLFSTFFAAHSLWNLIPATMAFGLLSLVTAIAVALSIRRESLFIAVLGLLGGFATPALLSTGENRPIPLFAYLLLLNVGLAWVAYRQTWPILTVFTLILTTIYQWGWVFKFLSQSDLSLAMGIFLLFPIVSIVGFLFAARSQDEDTREHATFERTAMFGATLPLLFAIYLAAVPAYGARPGLLFGFLALVDVGLFAITAARSQMGLHAVGA